tara:strand:+ start:3382 stop:3660 length:279 start_codon:yes stop_codon:yes gene_type:complete
MSEDINNRIARYEEHLAWLKKMTKETEDKLFCVKAELQEKEMNRYICDGCGFDIKNPTNISKPTPTIFSNLMLVTSDVQCPKCADMEKRNDR